MTSATVIGPSSITAPRNGRCDASRARRDGSRDVIPSTCESSSARSTSRHHHPGCPNETRPPSDSQTRMTGRWTWLRRGARVGVVTSAPLAAGVLLVWLIPTLLFGYPLVLLPL